MPKDFQTLLALSPGVIILIGLAGSLRLHGVWFCNSTINAISWRLVSGTSARAPISSGLRAFLAGAN